MAENTWREIDSLISEYLTWRGLLQTVAAFNTETALKATPSKKHLNNVYPEFMEAFECGEGRAFFELWNKHIPFQVQSESLTSQQLECNLSAYFAVYPIKTGIGNRELAMSEFRSYLDSRGSIISQNEDLAAYFALPYIPDPSKHPSFQKLFHKPWTDELQARLVQFLEKILPTPSSCPVLVTMYLNSKKESGLVIQEDSMQKVREVQGAYHTLCGIAMELVGALESSVAGQQISPEFISGICSRLFEGNSQPLPVIPPRPSTSTLRASILSLRQSVETTNLSQDFTSISFDKVAGVLQSGGSVSRQILLLQALRWRLTRSLPGLQRDAILDSYITNDLLGCCGGRGTDHTSSILALLRSPHPGLCEQMARLFNTFSSLASGRSYLSEAPSITIALLELLYGEKNEDTATRRNALGAIQKLSLRRSVSRLMIKHGIVRWIMENVLGEPDSLSDYTLRYSLALLMNISLRAIGRSSCVAHGPALLESLGRMLEHEKEEISEYVNGTLYSLFSSPQLQQQARQMGMDELLKEALQHSPAQRKTQIKYILQQLNQKTEEEGVWVEDSGDEGQDDDEDNESDPDMIEGDEGEVVIYNDVLRGEPLLVKEYTLDGDITEIRSEQAKLPATREQSFEQTREPLIHSQSQRDPLSRPVTPLSFRSHSSYTRTSTLPHLLPVRSIVSANDKIRN